MYVCTYVCMYESMYVYMYVCMYLYVKVYKVIFNMCVYTICVVSYEGIILFSGYIHRATIIRERTEKAAGSDILSGRADHPILGKT